MVITVVSWGDNPGEFGKQQENPLLGLSQHALIDGWRPREDEHGGTEEGAWIKACWSWLELRRNIVG